MNKRLSIGLLIVLALTSGVFADPRLVGNWGDKNSSELIFRPNGLMVMNGKIYKYTAAKGVWRYWLSTKPFEMIRAEYRLSNDGKSVKLNLTKGSPFKILKRVPTAKGPGRSAPGRATAGG